MSKSYLTQAEVDALQESVLNRKTPYVFQGVKNTQMSIAKYYGGITYNNESYQYIDETDELIRDDVFRLIQKGRAMEKRKAKKESDASKKPKSVAQKENEPELF